LSVNVDDMTPFRIAGIWPAFWLLPTEPFEWPGDGEIDILETWNGRRVNGTCLHWGKYDGPDHDKHRVWSLEIDDMDRAEGHEYGLAWDQSARKLVWYIDGKPEMKAKIPSGMRKLGEFQVMLNIAMGGNVQAGQRPHDGEYELVVHDLEIRSAPPGGWPAFDADWKRSRDGNTM
jgi:beta-glucanase (GH16 family)